MGRGLTWLSRMLRWALSKTKKTIKGHCSGQPVWGWPGALRPHSFPCMAVSLLHSPAFLLAQFRASLAGAWEMPRPVMEEPQPYSASQLSQSVPIGAGGAGQGGCERLDSVAFLGASRRQAGCIYQWWQKKSGWWHLFQPSHFIGRQNCGFVKASLCLLLKLINWQRRPLTACDCSVRAGSRSNAATSCPWPSGWQGFFLFRRVN